MWTFNIVFVVRACQVLFNVDLRHVDDIIRSIYSSDYVQMTIDYHYKLKREYHSRVDLYIALIDRGYSTESNRLPSFSDQLNFTSLTVNRCSNLRTSQNNSARNTFRWSLTDNKQTETRQKEKQKEQKS